MSSLRSIAAGFAVVFGLWGAAILPVDGRSAQDDLDTDALVARAAAYVHNYTTALAFVLADETYVQRRLRGGDLIEHRVLAGELFLTFLPDNREWMAIHDVAEVDGRPVEGRTDLRALLAAGTPPRDLGRRLAAENARYNIGGVTRNFNDPLLPLLIFHDDRIDAVRFDRDGTPTPVGDRTLVTLRFRERDGRTLIRSTRGQSLRASGSIVIDARTGGVHRTRFIIDDGPVSAELVTDYAWESHLGLLLPTLFRERYLDTRGDPDETIACEARYTNYRRFEVTGRVVPAQ